MTKNKTRDLQFLSYLNCRETSKEKEMRALEFYHKFYQLVELAGIAEFQKAMRTFRNWQTRILNSFVFPYSNGFLEGINNLTKVIKRNAFGFQNFARARGKILLTHKYKNIDVHVGWGEKDFASPQHLTGNLFGRMIGIESLSTLLMCVL